MSKVEKVEVVHFIVDDDCYSAVLDGSKKAVLSDACERSIVGLREFGCFLIRNGKFEINGMCGDDTPATLAMVTRVDFCSNVGLLNMMIISFEVEESFDSLDHFLDCVRSTTGVDIREVRP